MRLKAWFAQRGPAYIHKRMIALLDRYGITPSKAADRVLNCVAMLAEQGCAPTFPTPARVVQRHPEFFRHLQSAGAEIAVHGYDHVDLRDYPVAKACEQLERAADVFRRYGIDSYGFRCPYLGCTDELLDALPKGIFDYSSNRAIAWDVVSPGGDGDLNPAVSEVLRRLYRPLSAQDTVCIPRVRSDLVEIPTCLPDDLELHDALRLGPEGIAEAWSQILHRTHQRGELFVLMFHPELAMSCQQPLGVILRDATDLQPAVWIARLGDISSWWREKANFSTTITPMPGGLHISFRCSDRATILVRGLGAWGSEAPWDGSYHRLRHHELDVPAEPRPFVGLSADAPERWPSFLREQGYILDTGETAARCAAYIDAATLDKLASDVELVNLVESSPGPLARYWRWPDGAKSALSVTGDLDALTLFDHASRLVTR